MARPLTPHQTHRPRPRARLQAHVGARDLLARLEQWLAASLRSTKGCSELLARGPFEVARAARLQRLAAPPAWHIEAAASGLLRAAFPGQAVVSDAGCPDQWAEVAALRNLSYAGFVRTAWALLGRRAPRLAVLCEGDLGMRTARYTRIGRDELRAMMQP